MKNSIESLTGVVKMSTKDPIVKYVIEIMKDYEAHTTETIAEYVWEEHGIDIYGCATCAALGGVEDVKGYVIDTFGPYDSFGSPSRFKLVKVKEY